ncbi:PIN domain-containing protein [Microcoleus sp. ARI1-B5]|uniref:PIN domain-containing protein n=1 Tax=unclassified Microcoleus TaxID=2642155 RepID=UPI002FCFE09B
MKVLFDTNVLLDAMLAREPFVADAAFLLNAVESGRVEGLTSATTVTKKLGLKPGPSRATFIPVVYQSSPQSTESSSCASVPAILLNFSSL